MKCKVVMMVTIIAGCLTGVSVGAAMGGDPIKGRAIFEANCAVCHGAQGKGTAEGLRLNPPAEDLTGPRTARKSEAELLRAVHEGKANTAMPMWRYALSDEESRDVLAYVRMLTH